MEIIIKVMAENLVLNPLWDDDYFWNIPNPSSFNCRCQPDLTMNPELKVEDIEYEDVTHKRIEK